MNKDTDFFCSCIRTQSCNYCLTLDSLMLSSTNYVVCNEIGTTWQEWCSRLDSLIEDVAADNAYFLTELKTLVNENAD